MQKKLFLILLLVGFQSIVFSQNGNNKKDKAIFKEYKPGFYENSILKGVEEYEKPVVAPMRKSFKVDVNGLDAPTDPEKYTKQWYNEPVSQGNTGTCWCFSTTSFYESEVYRISKQKVKLSELYPVYWEYVERAKEFVKKRGDMNIGEGSEANAVARMYKMYGTVPLTAYTGLKQGQTFHSHEKMFGELEKYLKSVKERNAWSETEVVNTVKSILNFYLGEPPTSVSANGKNYSPKEYLKDVLKINTEDYVEILSLMQEPYYKMVEYKVPDNWWHSADYFNVPLDEYMGAIKKAIRAGYTLSIGGDVSEAGFVSDAQVAIVPSFDIPSEYIDENARQMRFSNGTTTDDHGVHLIGFAEKDGKDWYLIKDSGAGSRGCGQGCKTFGYYFFHEDYIKLKMMGFTVHKEAVKDLLQKKL